MKKEDEKVKKVKKTRSKRSKIILIVVLAVVAAAILLVGGIVLSVMTTSRPALRSVEEYEKAYPDASISVKSDGSVEIRPKNGVSDQKTGIIFYVGAGITPDAYIPLLASLAEEGYSCFAPKMTGNVASFKQNAAKDVMESNDEIESWYLAGHSLGGFTASGYVKKHADDVDGLIFLAAYTSADISDAGVPVLSVYGDRDGVLNRERYEKALAFCPDDFEEVIVKGGNHAQFGDYGLQPKDNEAQIDAEKQQSETVSAILAWIENHS